MPTRSVVAGIAIVGAIVMGPRLSGAETKLHPASGLGANTVDSFIGWPTLLHLSAVGATVGLVKSGADYETSVYFRDHPGWGRAGVGGYVLGYAAPIGGTVALYVAGRVAHDDKTLVAAYAVLQSSVMTLTTVTVLKLFTGRAPPEDYDFEHGSRDVGSSFRFGVYRGGVIDGWPSGHTAMVTAIAGTLTTYYRNWLVGVIGFSAAAYTGYSMSSYRGGTVHWLSDTVAGFLIALPIGTTVGRAFRARFDEERAEKTTTQTWSVYPLLSRGTLGLSIAGTL